MKIKEFQDRCDRTMLDTCKNWEYLTMGLISEVGEVAGSVKKFIRGDYNEDEVMSRLTQECGDVLWYFAMIAKYVSIGLNRINIENYQLIIDMYEPVTVATDSIYKLLISSNELVQYISSTMEYEETAQGLTTYTSNIFADKLGVVLRCIIAITNPNESMEYVINKLSARKEAGTLHGDGEGDRVQ